ncbi:MAG: hypothetical protein HY673_01600 [Chloroflexi bacterium]|nr:hypothetical protein [Chloroflexota bacterium]
MGQSVIPSNLRILEKLLRKYPDIPPEVVIKQDLLRLGQGFSDHALAAAAGADKKPYDLFSHDLVPMSDMQQQEYSKVPHYFIIRGGPYKLRPVMVVTAIAGDSPYLIDVIDGRLKLRLDGVAIADVGYRAPFRYYSSSFPDGVRYEDVIARGNHIIPFHFCQYWSASEECKFCDINENARQAKQLKADAMKAPVVPVERVATVANEVAKEVWERDGYPAPINFMISGGTITGRLHGLKEDEFYLRYVEAVKEGGPRRYVTLATNAADKVTLNEYHRRGVDSYYPNLEIWDKRLFEWICPGKANRVGWEEWVKRMLEAVDIFGEGNVRPALVCGVEMAQPHGFKTINEAVKSNTEGFRFLMAHGLNPNLHVWLREPNSYLQKKHNQPPVPAEYYLQLVRNYYENWIRYEVPWPRRISASPELRIMAFLNHIGDDYVLLTEQQDYENRALRALEKAGAIWCYDSKETPVQSAIV